MWQAQVDAFSSDYHVIAPDLRGFGSAEGNGDVFPMELFAADLAEMLDRLGITSPVIFCGLSMGGYVGWQFLRRFPDRVSHLIACDTRAVPDSQEAARGRREMADRVLLEGSELVANTLLPKLFSKATAERQPQILLAIRDVILATRAGSIAAALRGMAERLDATSLLANIRIPVLTICGAEDVISPVAEMRAFASQIPDARFVEVPDAGHMAPLENPVFVNQAIRQWLQDVDAR